MNDLFSLQGRTALVTGGSRGIGRMIASGFLAQGAKVYISSRKAEACEQTARELSSLGACIPFLVPALALTFGIIGFNQISKSNSEGGGRGMAIAGMIMGGIFFLIGALYWLYIIFVVGLSALFTIGGMLSR